MILMSKSSNNIDTGKMLERFLIKNRIVRSYLGRAINRTGVSIYRYTNNSTIQTGILLDICHALKHNFFYDIANQLPKDFTISKQNNVENGTFDINLQTLYEQLQEENKVLKIQNDLLMKIKM